MNDHATDTFSPSPPASFPLAPLTPEPAAGASATRLTELLHGLGDAATGELPLLGPASAERADAKVWLGMATSLFYALRTKHAPTAAHSLRVALSCSAWCQRLGLDEEHRDRIEVAALLHDIGKIGIPDRILCKPGKLTVQEQMSMDCCSGLACEILRGCIDDQKLLDIVEHNGTWFESRRADDSVRGEALPLGARMLSIAGAFDTMTTDQVYRAAMSRERALQELFRGSSTQFDPELTRDFTNMLEKRPEMMHECVVDHWLQQIQPNTTQLFGKSLPSSTPAALARAGLPTDSSNSPPLATIFTETGSSASSGEKDMARSQAYFKTLGKQLRDGIAFTDREGQILYWNESMAHLTRVAAGDSVGKPWDSVAMGFADTENTNAQECPIGECIDHQIVVTRSMKLLLGEGTDDSAIDGSSRPSRSVSELPGREVLVQAVPVGHEHGGGAVVIVRDISDRTEMQNQIQTLHKKATSDPLTGVANRAEFDQRLMHCTGKAKQQGVTFSLIMCDIDHFKKVNDIHGHQAGDEALIQFAKVLQRHTRGSDLVARYGGEEFAFLAINSDNATTTRRAEEIREAVSNTPLSGLDGESVTVSIGVTEYRTGDAPDTVIARADRALLHAKENGRNRVVQLGSGLVESDEEQQSSGWWHWLTASSKAEKQQKFELVTPVPTDLAVEKLRGFISDHRAEIINVNGSELALRLYVQGGSGRRAADHQLSVNAKIQLSESRSKRGTRGTSMTQTRIHVCITPVRGRDRRNACFAPCVRQVISSLKSYLMAEMVKDGVRD